MIKFNSPDDVVRFIRENRPEDSTLDYKSELASDHKGKLEIFKDVCAFANSGDAVLVYGIEDNEGYPGAIVGIEKMISHKPVREWYTQLIRDNITPQIRLSIWEVSHDDLSEVPENRIVLAVILESILWLRPHSYNEHLRKAFYIRRDTDSIPAKERKVRDMYFNSFNRPKLIMIPSFLPQLGWKPTIQIHNVGTGTAVNIHGNIYFGERIDEEMSEKHLKQYTQRKTVKIRMIAPGEHANILVHDMHSVITHKGSHRVVHV